MPDTNDKVRAKLLDLLLDPRCIALFLVGAIAGYVIGRIGV